MAIDYRADSPKILLEFLSYHETVKAHSQKTVDEYYLDLRNFFRYMKQLRDPSLIDLPMDEIDIRDIGIEFISSITLADVYSYLVYLSRDRLNRPNSETSDRGLSASTRARKVATLRSFFNYLCNKVHLLPDNPIKDIDSPKIKKTLPRYLTLEESIRLLESVDGPRSIYTLQKPNAFLEGKITGECFFDLGRIDILDRIVREEMHLVTKIVKKRTKCGHFSGAGGSRKTPIRGFAVGAVQTVPTEIHEIAVYIGQRDRADEFDADVAYIDLIHGQIDKRRIAQLLHVTEEVAQIEIILIHGFLRMCFDSFVI